MDHLSDFCARLNVAIERKKLSVIVLKTKMNINLLELLYQEGYISGFNVGERFIKINLKYNSGRSILQKLSVISKRSKRIYFSSKKLAYSKNNYIISTNKGIFFSRGNSFITVLGGEILCSIQ